MQNIDFSRPIVGGLVLATADMAIDGQNVNTSLMDGLALASCSVASQAFLNVMPVIDLIDPISNYEEELIAGALYAGVKPMLGFKYNNRSFFVNMLYGTGSLLVAEQIEPTVQGQLNAVTGQAGKSMAQRAQKQAMKAQENAIKAQVVADNVQANVQPEIL